MENLKENVYSKILFDVNERLNLASANLPSQIGGRVEDLKKLLADQFEEMFTKFNVRGGEKAVPLWVLRGETEDPDTKLSESAKFLKGFSAIVSKIGHLSHSHDVEFDLENNRDICAILDELNQFLPPAPKKILYKEIDLNALAAQERKK